MEGLVLTIEDNLYLMYKRDEVFAISRGHADYRAATASGVKLLVKGIYRATEVSKARLHLIDMDGNEESLMLSDLPMLISFISSYM